MGRDDEYVDVREPTQFRVSNATDSFGIPMPTKQVDDKATMSAVSRLKQRGALAKNAADEVVWWS